MELLDSDSELAMIADTEFQGISTDQAPELRLEFQHAMVKWHIHGWIPKSHTILNSLCECENGTTATAVLSVVLWLTN